jgi:hypothetical protein
VSPLAATIYAVLRTLAPCRGDPRLSYADLLSRLPDRFSHLDLEDPAHRDQISQALGEIVLACRARGLPALPALVVRLVEGELEYPGVGYHGLAHPEAADEIERLAAWGRELEAVKRTTYPETLQGGPPADPPASPALPHRVAWPWRPSSPACSRRRSRGCPRSKFGDRHPKGVLLHSW